MKTDACEISRFKKRYEVLDISKLLAMKRCNMELCALLQARIPRIDRTYFYLKLAFYFFMSCLSIIGFITAGILENVERFSDSPMTPYGPYIFFCRQCCLFFLIDKLFQIFIVINDEINCVKKNVIVLK